MVTASIDASARPKLQSRLYQLYILLPVQYKPKQSAQEVLYDLSRYRVDDSLLDILRAKIWDGSRKGVEEARAEHDEELLDNVC